MTRLSVIGSSVFLLLSVNAVSSTDPPLPLNSIHRQEIECLFDDEVWRPGGPRQDRISALVRDAVAGGNVYMYLEVDRQVEHLARRRLYDPRVLAPLLPQIAAMPVKGTSFETSSESVGAGLRSVIALWGLSAKERHDLYERAIKSEKNTYENVAGGVLALSWQTGALRALEEEMDDLMPLIERMQAERSGKSKDGAAISNEQALEDVYLPLARARGSRDWVGGYLEIIREPAGVDLTANPQERLLIERRADEALLRLVLKNRSDALPELEQTWKTVGAKEVSMRDRAFQRWAAVATPLARACIAFGSRTIDEKAMQKLGMIKPAEAEQDLRRAGLLRATDR